ncbi:MAG: hypothetical protein QF552_02795 [Litorilituus sp.]|jgi:hypothetical protein|nr:hypothetical protein [Litorilituus sp.]
MTVTFISDLTRLDLDASIDYTWLQGPLENSIPTITHYRNKLAKKWLKGEDFPPKKRIALFSFWDKTYSTNDSFHTVMKNFTQLSQSIDDLYCNILAGEKLSLSEVFAVSERIINYFSEETVKYAYFVKHPSTDALQTLRQAFVFLTFADKVNLRRDFWVDMLCGIVITDLAMTSILDDLSTRYTQKKTDSADMHTLIDIKELICFDREVSSLTMSLLERYCQQRQQSHLAGGIKGELSALYLKMYDMVRLYCTLTKSRKIQTSVCPLSSMDVILRQECNRGQSKIVFSFAEALALYPKGMMVELTSGEVVQIGLYTKDGLYQVKETVAKSKVKAQSVRLISPVQVKKIITAFFCNGDSFEDFSLLSSHLEIDAKNGHYEKL